MTLVTTWYPNILHQQRKAIFIYCGLKTSINSLTKIRVHTSKKNDLDNYINYITKSKNEWQVKQAQEAIRFIHICATC